MQHFRLFIVLLCLLITHLSHAKPTFSIKTLVAGGAYHKSGSPLPLLLVSNNNGQTWIFVPTISNKPCESYNGMILEASCNDVICSAVGSGFNKAPLLVSFDKGLSWALVPNVFGSPPHAIDLLSSISCGNKICVAAGNTLINNATLPLLIKSDSNGRSWSVINNISGLPGDIKSAELASVSCIGSLCNAVGHYQDKNNSSQLLILISKNDGESWSYTASNAVLPSDFDMSDLIVSCASNDTCIIAGHYNKTTNLPFLLISNDRGNTWSMVERINGRPLEMTDGQFYSVTCTGKVCIGSGVYRENDVNLPLLVQSKDSGKTWSIARNILNLPDNMVAAELSSVSCSDKLCVAAGYYRMDSNELPYLPMLLVSSDSGGSWLFIEKIANFPSKSASFHAVNCFEDTCSAAGEYNHMADIDLPPPLVVSNDKGQTWRFVENIPDFPNGLKSAEVFALTATESK